MHGFVRQLFDYDGSNLFPRTRPDAFVSCLRDSAAVGITTIGELIDTSYLDPSAAWETDMGWEPEFIYRINPEQNRVTGDSSGTMKAAKISQIPGLKFNAALSNDLVVTNPVGQATYGRQYPAGTLLEAIIIDMLTGGISVYDVSTHLPDCSINATITSVRGAISNNSTLDLAEGETYLLTYGYTNFKDGYFYRGNTGYPHELYVQYNSSGTNASHFRNDELHADVSILSLQLIKDEVQTMKTMIPQNPGPLTYPNATDNCEITVTEGTHKYEIKVFYSAKETTCHPYKSNGMESAADILGGSRTFTFYIHGIEASDVEPNNPTVKRTDTNSTDPNTLIIGTTNASFNDIVIKSIYDIEHNTSTGIWSGDDVSLSANIHRLFVDGYFTPGSGYDIGQFNNNNNVLDGKLPAGNAVQGVSWQSGAAASYTIENNIINVVQNNLLSSSVGTSNTVKLNINYGRSTVVAIKSDNQPSNVSVNAGTIVLTGTYNASTEIHVASHIPEVSIYQISINDTQHGRSDHEPNVHSIGCTVDGYMNISIKDGYYTPGINYNVSTFLNNNPEAYLDTHINKYKVDANCSPITITSATVNGVQCSSVTAPHWSPTSHEYTVTANFEGLTLQEDNVFKITVSYSNSQVMAKKLSGRPDDDHTISAGNVSATRNIHYDPIQRTYHFLVIGNPTDSGNIQTSFSNVLELISNASTNIHWQQDRNDTPDSITSNGVEQVGAPYKTVIAIAPSDYNTFSLKVSSQPLSWSTTITMPYSDTDDTIYKLFIDGRASAIGYNLDPEGGIQIKKLQR